MYNTWTEITHRDLIQKGGFFKDLKELNVDKIVLKMSLTRKDGGIVYEKKGQTGKKGSKTKSVGKDSERDAEKKRLMAEGSSEQVSSLTLLSLLAILSGQRPALTYARKSIANWKLRKGQLLGCKVSLRGTAALAFLDKTIRFQNLNQSDSSSLALVAQSAGKGETAEQSKGLAFEPEGAGKVLNAQNLGNLSIGITSLHLYPELDSLWIQIAAIFGHQTLGLDLALAFKNTKNFTFLIRQVSVQQRKGPGTSLISEIKINPNASLSKGLAKSVNSFNPRQKLADLVLLRKLYLTSLGLVIKV